MSPPRRPALEGRRHLSRKTGYKIFNRDKDERLEALSDRSRRPVRYVNQVPDPVEAMISATDEGEATLGCAQYPVASGRQACRRYI